MVSIKWPSLEQIVKRLSPIYRQLLDALSKNPTLKGEERWIKVQLQVKKDGEWKIHAGEPITDVLLRDDEGFWGEDWIGERSCLLEIAGTLLEEAKDFAHVAGYD